jgi:hypothetical protein
MDDHLQSAAARFGFWFSRPETELATWYTWNVLADPAKHSWVQTAIRQQEAGMLAIERVV